MYDSFAADYDRFNNWPQRLTFELPFIEKLLGSLKTTEGQKASVLDAACGTGQHALALAKKGYTVSGADLSPAMIEIAKGNAHAAALEADFRAAGFGSLSGTFGRETFDAVLCLGNSLPHLLNASDLQTALSDFAACLRPSGRLLVQNRNFDTVMKNHQRWMDPQPFSDGSHEWLFQRFYDFESNGLIRFNIVSLKRARGGDWISSIDSTFLAPQLSTELQAAVSAAGFSGIELFGSLSGEPFDPHASGNLVLAAVK